jgi:3-hydroxyisobutyrate dehydrogenase-like beta-hydroxyacid dehydrogenase
MGENANLGFLGLGQMGGAMAERLLGKGARLHVFDVSPAAMRSFTDRGAVAHSSPRSVADAASIVFACLPSRKVSEDVAFGADGVASGSAVKIYVEMSTIGRTCIQAIASALDRKGIHTVDAPISGGPPGARQGTLAMMVAGSPADVAAVTPWLRLIGKDVYVLGSTPGQAQVMKLVNNLVMAANMVVASEGLVMGAKAGLDPSQMMEVLNAGTGRSAASADILARSALTGSFDFGARLAIVDKDVALGLSEAEALDVPTAVIAQAGKVWRHAATDGRGEDDFSSIIKVIEERGGAVVRAR